MNSPESGPQYVGGAVREPAGICPNIGITRAPEEDAGVALPEGRPAPSVLDRRPTQQPPPEGLPVYVASPTQPSPARSLPEQSGSPTGRAPAHPCVTQTGVEQTREEHPPPGEYLLDEQSSGEQSRVNDLVPWVFLAVIFPPFGWIAYIRGHKDAADGPRGKWAFKGAALGSLLAVVYSLVGAGIVGHYFNRGSRADRVACGFDGPCPMF